MKRLVSLRETWNVQIGEALPKGMTAVDHSLEQQWNFLLESAFPFMLFLFLSFDV